MEQRPLHSVCLTVPAAKDAASRARKQFNTLIKNLEAARLNLYNWQNTMPAVMSRAAHEYAPLCDAYEAHQRELVFLLDRMYREKVKAKRERGKLSEVIFSLALDLLEAGEDAELKAIADAYGDDPFDDPFDDSFPPDEEFAAFAAQLDKLFARDKEGRPRAPSTDEILEALGQEPEGEDEGGERPAGPKPNAAQRRRARAEQAREERAAVEEGKLKQTVRDIFRKLTSELHPDRETDHDERMRKTALMQRVTVAYKANDLLTLLELQLEIEQVNQSDLNGLSEERIRQFNKVLERQLREIELEVRGFEYAAQMQCDGMLGPRPTPKKFVLRLEADISDMQANLREIEAELEALQDLKALKVWLKRWKPAIDPDDGFWD